MKIDIYLDEFKPDNMIQANVESEIQIAGILTSGFHYNSIYGRKYIPPHRIDSIIIPPNQ
jgi:hypothetical protein